MTSSMNVLSVLLLFAAIFNSPAAAQICSQTAGNFTANSTYAGNRALLLSSLSSNLSSSYGFFMNTTVGYGADRIYGLALCRADSTPDTCNKCVNKGVKQLTDSCPNQKEAITWASESPFPCIVRYANRFVLGKVETSPAPPILYNTGVIASDQREEFHQIWESHMSSLIAKASKGTKIKYASGDTNLTALQTIYAATQCTPDLSQSDCDFCLRQIVGAFENCCGNNTGGVSQNPSCIFRWDMYPFYNSFTEIAPAAPLLPPPPANTTNSRSTNI